MALPRFHSSLIAITVFLGSFLLFSVQPLLGKYLLPWFGGAPAVWTVCLLFFQTALLAGYAYAHGLTRLVRSSRGQAAVHGIALMLAVVTLPIVPSDRWVSGNETNDPVARIVITLLVSVGLPYFVLSATGPLLQTWWTGLVPGRAPYRLYALSNVASFGALLSFPLVIEPSWSRLQQARVWSIAFGAFALACAGCSLIVLRRPPSPRTQGEGEGEGTPDRRKREYVQNPLPNPLPAYREREAGHVRAASLWLALPAVASLLLMAVTNTICQDAAVVPFLWVLPLAIYLASFIVAFDGPRWYARSVFVPLMFLAIAASCWAILGRDEQQLGLKGQIAIHCTALAVTCMVCHGELYRLRPPAERLTSFYLAIAAGGAAGGLLVALVAPRVLKSYAELQIGFGAALLLTMVVLYIDPASALSRGRHFFAWLGVWVAVALVMMLLYVTAGESGAGRGSVAVERTRNFFGVLSVYERSADDPVLHQRVLQHGGVTHGKQFVLPSRRAIPTSYYTPDSGAGLLLRAFPKASNRRIAIVGLGVGTLVAYAREGDTFVGYEINPEVVRLARQHFTYLTDTPAAVRIVLGDGRLSIAREPRDTMFDILLLDAFSGDAIPVHLLTEQAFALYLDHLDPAGAIAVHISNHHLNLLPVLTRLAERFDLDVAQYLTDANESMAGDASHWVVLTRRANRSLLEIPMLKDAAEPIRIEPRFVSLPLWTDEYTALVPLLR